MKRLTPEQVVEAYTSAGLTPAQGAYYRPSLNNACGIGAVVIASGAFDGDPIHFWSTFTNGLGFDESYHNGFTTGFDTVWLPSEMMDLEERIQPGFADGYADGRAAWDAVQSLIPEQEG